MEHHGVPIERVINGGGIPQRNQVLNQVYANVLNKPVLVPADDVTSLGSAIFAFLAAGTFSSVPEPKRRSAPITKSSSRSPALAPHTTNYSATSQFALPRIRT